MSDEVSANTMRVVLQSVQQVSGMQYESLLRQAGLAHYLDQPAPDSWTMVSTGDELVRLFSAVYAMLGESLFRLFQRNYGQAAIDQVLGLQWGRDLRAQAPQIPADRRYAWLVQEIVTLSERSWSPQIVTEDAAAWYMAAQVCRTCQGIHGASAPICAARPALYIGLARVVLGHPIRCTEIACVAAGQEHCTVAFYKD